MPDSNKNKHMFDKFTIIQCIKQDACSGVYIADHIYLGKKIFLKTLNVDNLPDTALLSRFKREAKTLARLEHPNIIKVFDFGSWKNYFYISFEYFESKNLRQFLKADILTDEQKAALVAQMANALKYAHHNRIIHRDIKPENVLVDETLHLKIADFGLALIKDETSVTAATSIVGTPAYMSPEQIRGETLTARSDLFSFGILIYELYFKNNPFLGSDAGQTINNILNKVVDIRTGSGPNLPAGLQSLLTGLLNKNPQKRPESVDEILKIFPLPSDNSGTAATAALKQAGPFFSRRITAALIVIIILVTAGYFLRESPEVDIPPAQTDSSLSAVTIRDSQETVSDPVPAAKILAPENEQPEISRPSPAKTDIPDSAPGETILLSGDLQVECSPWAYVYIDSAKLGSTPLRRAISLIPGTYRLGLDHPDYPFYSRRIKIAPEQTTLFKVDLDSTVGSLFVMVFPWADIYIDDKYRGQTPLKSALKLRPGYHEISVRNPEFADARSGHIVQKQKSDTLEFHLKDFREMSQNDSEPE